MYIIIMIRMFSNISTFYAWRYIHVTDESSLVTIINNFVLKKIACTCIYSEESNEMVH